MRVLVTGSRDWDDEELVGDRLDALYGTAAGEGHTEFVVVHGDCPTGADRHAKRWVYTMVDTPGHTMPEVSEEPHPARWRDHQPQCSQRCRSVRHCKRAGFVRNAEMVEAGAHWCLAFIKDHSNGASHTLDTINSIERSSR